MLLQLNGVLPEKLEKRLIANQDPKNPIVMMMDSEPVVISQTSHTCCSVWSDGGSGMDVLWNSLTFQTREGFVIPKCSS